MVISSVAVVLLALLVDVWLERPGREPLLSGVVPGQLGLDELFEGVERPVILWVEPTFGDLS
ncbi:MAG: hypothetical protein EOM24_16255 [Chloroflexia bacterium]|nr:hypothetical protein [Chloroflexia bacterium]